MSLKKFEILEMIAKGGMAEVYRAKTTGFKGFEKEVCVKKILPHLTEDDSFVNMFIDEAKLAATLNYANIVQVHDLCVSASGEYFIVMEFVNGKDLSDVIRAAQLGGREVPPAIAVQILRETCKALYYAHNKKDPNGVHLNIVHRDVSPHNVLVSLMGEVKLTDFGIAKAATSLNKTAVGILKGKYGYMSPEQARGQRPDHRSDIFNCGIVLYELLVGERCFAGASDFSTLNMMRNAEVTPPTKINSSISADLEAIVLKALSRDVKDRYQDAMEMERALAAYAKKTMEIAQATDLAEFMRGLFSGADSERLGDGSTGVLALSSVVGPPPKSDKEKAKHQTAQLPPEPVKSGTSEPGQSAAARLKRKATKAKPATAAKVATPKVESPQTAPAPKPASAPKSPPKKPASAPRPPPVAKTDAIKRKPARIKKKGSEPKRAAKKSKRKTPSSTPKKPVGRKHLKPGITQIRALQGSSGRRSWLWAIAAMLAFGIVGAALGVFRSGQLARQKTFRETELTSRDGSGGDTVSVLIETKPSGATVRLDNVELSERTPLAVQRDRDGKEHQIELSMEGFSSSSASIKYAEGPLTRFSTRLTGKTGVLEISSNPAGAPIRIDGKLNGKTPLSEEFPAGTYLIEIGDPARHDIVKEEFTLEPGGTLAINRSVADKGKAAELLVSSFPRAEIFVDGRSTGMWTGTGAVRLSPDVDHVVELRPKVKKLSEAIKVRLTRGEKKRLYVDLSDA